MTGLDKIDFQLLIMGLAEDCKTADDYRRLSEELHDCIEDAIQEMCMDACIDDYDPPY